MTTNVETDIRKYRPFVQSDTFPGLPKDMVPMLICYGDSYTFVVAWRDDVEFIFAWDRVSKLYNYFEYYDLM